MNLGIKTKIYTIASGDQRLAANRTCWPCQHAFEERFADAVRKNWPDFEVIRGHVVDPEEGHGFISSQREGMDVFREIPTDAIVVMVCTVWQYSYHVLPGLHTHRGPVLTLSNWSGQWPGLVGLLNLNASLTKLGHVYSTLWTEDCNDKFFLRKMGEFLRTGRIVHDLSHVTPFDVALLDDIENYEQFVQLGKKEAARLLEEKAIMGVFDEFCMGMYNATFEDRLLNDIGIWKERLSQSALLAEMKLVEEAEARSFYEWLVAKGMKFEFGSDGSEDLTESQVLEQGKMYIAAVRMAHRFRCDLIGIQYQLGLVNSCVASDLCEGLMNNVDRPPVYPSPNPSGEQGELFKGRPVVHFNEVDEGAGVDALINNRIMGALVESSLMADGDPATTLHDVRWGFETQATAVKDGEFVTENVFVFVLEISGSVPPSHLVDGFRGSTSCRQPKMYFPLGGGTVKGVSRPGKVVISRVYVERSCLHCDIGIATCVMLSESDNEMIWNETTKEWPIMTVTLDGISRDQFMAKHKANHVQVIYATNPRGFLLAKAVALRELGIVVNVIGNV